MNLIGNNLVSTLTKNQLSKNEKNKINLKIIH